MGCRSPSSATSSAVLVVVVVVVWGFEVVCTTDVLPPDCICIEWRRPTALEASCEDAGGDLCDVRRMFKTPETASSYSEINRTRCLPPVHLKRGTLLGHR